MKPLLLLDILSAALLAVCCGGVPAPAPATGCGLHTRYPGDDACLPGAQYRYGPDDYDDPDAVEQYLLQPGDETLRYQNVGSHEAVFIAGYDVSERIGVHHLAFYNASSGVPDATKALINPALFLAQTARESVRFPDGAALHLQRDSFVIAAHALNTTDAPILVEAWVSLRTVDDAPVRLSALQMVGGAAMAVPPGTRQTIHAAVTAGQPIGIVQLAGHFHAHTTEERASLDGSEVYRTDSWQEPDVTWFSPPLHVTAGGVLSWECDVDNTTTGTLRWSNSVQAGEMCNVVGFVTGPASWSVKVN